MKKLIIIMLMGSVCFAAPAYHGEIEFKHNDGSTFSANLKGDEHFSWIEDKQGNIIKYNKVSKNYEYAEIKINKGKTELVSTGIKVNKNGELFSPSNLGETISKEKLFEIWNRKKEERKFSH